jgi:Ca-activated chloride channel family protein
MIGLGVNPVPSDPNEQRITQAEAFVARMGAMDQAEIISFAGGPAAYTVVQTFTSDKVKLKNALEGLRGKEGGNTPLYDSMLKSVNDLHALSGTFLRAGIVLTDGRDDESTATPATIITTGRNDGIPVFSIGLGNPNDAASLDRATLQSIADSTGGRFFFSADSTGLQSVFDQLTDLLADSYRLESAVSFNPPLTTAGAYTITGDVTCTVDGETRSVPMAPISVSVQ